MKVDLIVGARPNYMKVVPVYEQLKLSDKFQVRLVHTGQHYDRKMSRIFFEELGLPEPDIYLGVGSGRHGEQTGKIMERYEREVIQDSPDLTIVFGDVNSTMACALVAVKLGIKVAHVEAGLRSRDWSMPEEINRIVTDRVADLLFTTCRDANQNLIREGVPESSIFFVGNTMIDTLVKFLPAVEKLPFPEGLELEPGDYVLVTLHRPSNVDRRETYLGIFQAFQKIQEHIKIVFPIHPRSLKMLYKFGMKDLIAQMPWLKLVEPLGYLEFLKLEKNARLVMTDSGGIQEETTYLQIPCLTLRENTERPITIEIGTNQLVGMNPDVIVEKALEILNGKVVTGQVPEYWDGKAASRIVSVLEKLA